MKQKVIILMALSLLVAWSDLMACSISVNDNLQKNLLAAFGASHLDLSLASVSKTTFHSYSKVAEEEDPDTLCPQYLRTTAKISFKYSPGVLRNCEATVKVSRRQFIGEVPEGPIETLSFSEVSSSCSVRPIIIRPIRIGHP